MAYFSIFMALHLWFLFLLTHLVQVRMLLPCVLIVFCHYM